MTDFLGKISSGIDKGLKTISSKSKELIETSKLKGEIKEVESSLLGRFADLGRKVYEMLNKGEPDVPELRNDAQAITDLYRRIAELQEALKRVEQQAAQAKHGADTALCPKCGAENKPGDKFCGGCGASLAGGTAAACPSCGAPAKEGVKFCGGCGAKIS